MKTITMQVPDWITEEEIAKILAEYSKWKSNLNLILALIGARIDESVLKEIEDLFEKWKQYLIHQ